MDTKISPLPPTWKSLILHAVLGNFWKFFRFWQFAPPANSAIFIPYIKNPRVLVLTFFDWKTFFNIWQTVKICWKMPINVTRNVSTRIFSPKFLNYALATKISFSFFPLFLQCFVINCHEWWKKLVNHSQYCLFTQLKMTKNSRKMQIFANYWPTVAL